jgi:hypothetical protein
LWDWISPPIRIPLPWKHQALEALGTRVDRVWDLVFPMAYEIPGSKAVLFILNSNDKNDSIVNNALGRLTQDSLARLTAMQKHYRGWAQFYTLHHHVAMPPFRSGFFGDVQSDMMVLLNAADLIQRLPNTGKTVVFHGHRHIGYTGLLNGNIQIISAPSGTLGNEKLTPDKRTPGFYSYRMVFQKDRVEIKSQRFWS